MNWTPLVFAALLWISPGESAPCKEDKMCKKLKDCLKDRCSKDSSLINREKVYVVADNFNGVLKGQHYWKEAGQSCIIFLQKNATRHNAESWHKRWPQMETENGTSLFHIRKWHIKKALSFTFLLGDKCNKTLSNYTDWVCNKKRSTQGPPLAPGGKCEVTCVQTAEVCDKKSFDKHFCNKEAPKAKNKFIIYVNGTKTSCVNCNNPVKRPEMKLRPEDLSDELNVSIQLSEEGLDPVQASNVMKKMGQLAASINTSSAALDMGGGVTGIIVRETEEDNVDKVSFAYASLKDDINIIDNEDVLALFPRSVTVPKEAFDQVISLNVSVPFVSIFRFPNLAKDELNSTLLSNEVLAVEMGEQVYNLTSKIALHFLNVTYEGNASCQSWDGEGSRPNWTTDGCFTVLNGDNITCECSHLTFFAILLTPPNVTISSADLNNLTIITQVGCSVSIFFMCIILFMHFLVRKTQTSTATRILIHLVSAIFMLNLTFLLNHHVSNLKSSLGCVIMAAVMHYFMLATFTWFAVNAFHLCLQLYKGGKIVISHYILKVTIISWVLPIVPGIVLLVKGKYGEQVIHTNNPQENVAICWITDSDAHYIVNIGYYALVFLFTFATFVIILSWLIFLKRTKSGNSQTGTSGSSILAVLGLCFMLGITWGFAFFAYGALLIPSYYIFTVLNSFQGFFLFIYYTKTKNLRGTNADSSGVTDSKSTLDTLGDSMNPYNVKMAQKTKSSED